MIREAETSRAEIARATGLARSTVSQRGHVAVASQPSQLRRERPQLDAALAATEDAEGAQLDQRVVDLEDRGVWLVVVEPAQWRGGS